MNTPVPAGLKILSGERSGFVLYPLAVDTLIGRLESVDVFLPDQRCSRKHCLIHWIPTGFVVVDLSANGTFVNDVRISPTVEHPLKTGDQIRVGGTTFEFRLAGAPAGAPAVEPAPAAPAPEFEFDFSEQTSDALGGLNKVFDTQQIGKWSSQTTQRVPRVDPNKLPPKE